MKKIAILGAECSGKTTLVKHLALKYKSIAVFEYLRFYCNKSNIPTSNTEQIQIAKKQIQIENYSIIQAQKANQKYIFCDTSPLLTYVYSLYYLEHNDTLLNLALQHHQSYEYTILLKPSINWIFDNMRDSDKARQEVYIMLKNILDKYKIKYRLLDISCLNI